MRELIEEWAESQGTELGLLETSDFDDAIVGVARRGSSWFVVYDEERVLAVLLKGGATAEDAAEHFDYNIAGAWMGEATPAFLTAIGSIVVDDDANTITMSAGQQKGVARA